MEAREHKIQRTLPRTIEEKCRASTDSGHIDTSIQHTSALCPARGSEIFDIPLKPTGRVGESIYKNGHDFNKWV